MSIIDSSVNINSSNTSVNNIINNNNYKEKVKGQIKIMKKFTVLTLFSLFFTIFSIIFAIMALSVLGSITTNSKIPIASYMTCLSIDNFVSLLCVTLQYDVGINKTLYDICCKKCQNISIVGGCNDEQIKNIEVIAKEFQV